jgi:hypothetical protein
VTRRRIPAAVERERVPPSAKTKGEVARGRLPSLHTLGGRRCFVRVHMWRGFAELRASHPQGEDDRFFGLFQVNNAVERRIGDLHLALDAFTMEIVAHELTHALIHRILVHGPDPTAVVLQARDDRLLFGRAPSFHGGSADEEIAYEMGRWVSATYRWAYALWRRHAKRKR